MNTQQRMQFQWIAYCCERNKSSVNVGSRVRRDAIVAAWDEIVELRSQNKRLREVLDKVMEWYDHGITWHMVKVHWRVTTIVTP